MSDRVSAYALIKQQGHGSASLSLIFAVEVKVNMKVQPEHQTDSITANLIVL
jgi:hypothetical protein